MTSISTTDPAAELVRRRYDRSAPFYDLEQALPERFIVSRLRRDLWSRGHAYAVRPASWKSASEPASTWPIIPTLATSRRLTSPSACLSERRLAPSAVAFPSISG